MAFRNEFELSSEIILGLKDIFQSQYAMIEHNQQKLFSFTDGPYADIKEYYNKLSPEHLNIVYSISGQPLMAVFAITGKRSIKIERIFNKKNLKCLGIRVFKKTEIPMHIDANYQNIGRANPVCSITISAAKNSAIYVSNRKDGSHQVAFSGVGLFYFNPTEIAHGAHSGDLDLDLLQFMVDDI